MKSKNKLEETDIKNRVCYYFNDIINGTDINLSNILLDKKFMNIFQFISFCIKFKLVKNHCILGLIKQMDLLYPLTVKSNT